MVDSQELKTNIKKKDFHYMDIICKGLRNTHKIYAITLNVTNSANTEKKERMKSKYKRIRLLKRIDCWWKKGRKVREAFKSYFTKGTMIFR